MPELPEVEIIRRGLAPHLLDKSLRHFWYSGKPLRRPVPQVELKNLCDIPITAVKRRAKYIILELAPHLLIFHLGMTGNLGLFTTNSTRRKHDHLEWQIGDNQLLRYHDTRRFGAVSIIDGTHPEEVNSFFKACGPEPLSTDFTAKYLQRMATRRKLAVKSFLMTNQVVVGIGNIYANEALFAAKIRPERSVKSVRFPEWQRLVAAIQKVLTQAIECGGSTISDFQNASQQDGYFQMYFQVYGRHREPCRTCGTELNKITLGGRASFFCPRCQR